jgi:GWxTD domain-containing protein
MSFNLLGLQVAVSPLVFKAEGSAFVELNYQIIGKSVIFDSIGQNGLQASVDITVLFKQAGQIVDFDKYRLTSPLTKGPKDFIDIRRYPLKAGKYELEINFEDSRDSTNRFQFQEKIEIPDYSLADANFSSLKLLASLKKADESSKMQWVQHGLIMEPLPHHFYDKRQEHLSFYIELYNVGAIAERPLLLKTEILNQRDTAWKSVQVSYQKLDSYNDVEPFARKVNIKKLSSDYYKLKVSLIDGKKQEYLSKETLFARSNPKQDQKLKESLLANKSKNFFSDMEQEELEYALRAIAPIAPNDDQERINFLVSQGTAEMRRDFLYGYWVERDPVQTERSYNQYMALARALDEKYYSAFGHGFETDRGRIYLKYGPPTQIAKRENDQAAKPYEIWSYDRIEMYNQNNVKFVFYNPRLAGNDFEILHSNCRNEIQNPQWLQYIYQGPDEFEGNPVDGTGVKDNFAREAERLFNDN